MRRTRYLGQLYSYLNLLRGARRAPRRRFILFTQGRSGSTLLEQLLNNHPSIRCDTEILNRTFFGRVVVPRAFIEGRARCMRSEAYGFKLHLTHLTDDQDIRDPGRFLLDMHHCQWKIIHVVRDNLFRQALSNCVAKQTGVWHRSKDQTGSRPPAVTIDGNQLMTAIRWRANQLAREQQLIQDIPHLGINYERDLLNNEQHHTTANRLFAFLELPEHPVSATLKRTSRDDPSEYIANYHEVIDLLAASEFAHYVNP